MKKILQRQRSAYALSLVFFSTWLVTSFLILWKTWPEVSSSTDPFSTFLTLIWNESLDFIPGLQFKLVYLAILGTVMLVSGVLIWLMSRRWFLLPGEDNLFQCPFCKKTWRGKGDKGLVHCPHCRQLAHPRIVYK